MTRKLCSKGAQSIFKYFEFLREFNLIEFNYWAWNLLLPEELFFIWYYLKALLHKGNSILLYLVPQSLYRALFACRKDGLYRYPL